MTRVLIVEDEPAAGRYLRSLIELRRPDFRVLGVAENGRDAIEQVSRLRPDLVVTDVKMPVMDGIELVAALNKDYPSLPVVIVSGYQEFENVRRVLDTGVVDYLLKPVDPIKLEQVLDRLGSQLSSRAEARLAEALAGAVNGRGVGAASFVFPEERFWLALARVGGLPSRFRLEEATERRATRVGGLFVVPGRDCRERMYLGPAERVAREAFVAAVSAGAGGEASSFTTVLVPAEASRVDQLREAARSACRDVDKLLVAGLTQTHCGAVACRPEAAWDKALADRIEFALRESRVDLLERAIRDMAEAWKARRATLLEIESTQRRILYLVLRKAPHANASVAADLEYLLEEALAASNDFDELSDAAWSLVAKAAGVENFESRSSGVPVFFHAIIRYVEGRYSEPLNLGSLSETFRISSSYLSKLFRQHAGRSFGEFLSAIRIDAAKRLISESPDMPLKDVAERVGFNDPFYFSRVFKSIAGLPPSDYSKASSGEAPGAAK